MAPLIENNPKQSGKARVDLPSMLYALLEKSTCYFSWGTALKVVAAALMTVPSQFLLPPREPVELHSCYKNRIGRTDEQGAFLELTLLKFTIAWKQLLNVHDSRIVCTGSVMYVMWNATRLRCNGSSVNYRRGHALYRICCFCQCPVLTLVQGCAQVKATGFLAAKGNFCIGWMFKIIESSSLLISVQLLRKATKRMRTHWRTTNSGSSIWNLQAWTPKTGD